MSDWHKECGEYTAETQSVIKGKETASKQEVVCVGGAGSGTAPHLRGCNFVTVCWRSLSGQPQAVDSTGALAQVGIRQAVLLFPPRPHSPRTALLPIHSDVLSHVQEEFTG